MTAKLSIGQRVMAPVKKTGGSKRELKDVFVSWISSDGRVVEVESVRHRKRLGSFPRGSLRPVGTASPKMGVVL